MVAVIDGMGYTLFGVTLRHLEIWGSKGFLTARAV